MVEPGGLEPELVVGQVIGLVRWQGAATVDAAGTKAFGPGRIDHALVVELVGQVGAAERARLGRGLVEGLARRAVERGRPLGADRLAVGRDPAPVAEAEEALEAVLGAEVAAPDGARQLVGEVEGQLAANRLVVVPAYLLGQPDRVGPAGDGLL